MEAGGGFRFGDFARLAFGESEVQQIGLAFQVQHDVAGLEVAMHYTLLMRMV